MMLAMNFGCDRAPREDTPQAALVVVKAKSVLAKPDPFRMAYNADARTLNLYDLSDVEGRWMLVSPQNKSGEPVNIDHAFMTDVDLDAVAVFYTNSSGLVSPRVTLREIVTVNVVHNGKN